MYKKIFFYSLKQNILLKQTQTNTNSFADFLALIHEHLSLFWSGTQYVLYYWVYTLKTTEVTADKTDFWWLESAGYEKTS